MKLDNTFLTLFSHATKARTFYESVKLPETPRTLQATPEVDCKWVSYSSIFQAVHLRNAKRTFVESLTIKLHSFQDQPECISPANTLSQRYT